MRTFLIALVVASSMGAFPAAARSISLSYRDRPTVDPAAGFAEDCWGESEAEDCAVRAALLETELVEHLVSLVDRNDEENVRLFDAMLSLPSPRAQEVALEFFSSYTPTPTSIWDRVEVFFFGPDALVGHPAAVVLGLSNDARSVSMSQSYLEGRPFTQYGGFLPDGAGDTDSWVEGRVRDLTFDRVEGFLDEERFTNSSRLLMVDRFLPDSASVDALREIPVTGFATSAPIDDVLAHFTAVFGGPPLPSLVETRATRETLLAEMNALQPRLLSGDASAGERFAAINEELLSLSDAEYVASRLGVEQLGCEDHAIFTDLPLDAPLAGPMRRSVVVGNDALTGHVVIRHFAPLSEGGMPGYDGGTGSSDDTPDDYGCECASSSLPPIPRLPGWVALVGLAGFVVVRRPRH